MGDWKMGSVNFGFHGQKGRDAGSFSTGGASHLIRSAEKLAASGRFEFAIEQLSVAARLDPDNKYIQAIIDRIRVAQNPSQNGLDSLAQQSTPLSISVGTQFRDGIRSADEGQVLTPEEVHTRIRSLTNMAEQYLDSGSSEKAFDSLMNAYLLDPLSPYVIASEKTVLPAWESAKKQLKRLHTNRDSEVSVQELNIEFNVGQTNMASSSNNGLNSPFASRPTQIGSVSQSADEQLRMEMLKQQKEQERLEKERVVWREASKPSRVFGEDDPLNSSVQPQSAVEQTKPQPTGLFSKLRLGKFLE